MELTAKEHKAIARIQEAAEIAERMGKTLIVAYSGGKDSDVLLHLAIKSGAEFEAQHNHTTVDAPETVYHIRAVFKILKERGIPTKINMPPDITDVNGKTVRATMWNLIPKKMMPPTQLVRYCCEFFKERRFEGQHLLFGIRWDEGNKRKSRGVHETIGTRIQDKVVYSDENDDRRKIFEICQMKSQIATNPIIDWTNREIWDYIRREGIATNPLYAKGFKRVGCIGCPFGGYAVKMREFAMFPKYQAAYIRAFDQMLKHREKRGKKPFTKGKDAESVFRWWTDLKFDPNQMTIDGWEAGNPDDD